MADDYRDLVIDALALDEVELRERLVDVTIERNTYRELLSAALERLHHASACLDRARARIVQILEALRAVRAGRPT